MTNFQSGTFAEIQCNNGMYPNGDNLIICLKDGTWDSDPPECIKEDKTINDSETSTTTKSVIKLLRPDRTFWKNFHSYLFYGCQPAEKTKRSMLCDRYSSNLTDLTSMIEYNAGFSLTFEHQQLLDLFQKTLASINFGIIDISNFIQFILYQNETEPEDHFDSNIENSCRLMLCYYIHTIAVEEDSKIRTNTNANESEPYELEDKIKRSLRQIVQPVFEKFLQPIDSNDPSSRPLINNAIQSIIAAKEREKEKYI